MKTQRQRKRIVRPGLALGLFSLLAAWALWPLPLHFTSALPSGDSPIGTVPMLNAWTVWWNAESLSHGLRDYWNAPIFHPNSGTFAFSEPQPITLLLAPVVYATNSPIVAYNLYLFVSLILNAVCATRLLLVARCRTTAAFAGGIAVLLHPLAMHNLEAVQLVPLWSILWTIERWVVFARHPSFVGGIWVGLGFGLTTLICVHHALFFALLIGPCIWFAVPYSRVRFMVPGLSIATLIAMVIALPIIVPLHRTHRDYAITRHPDLVRVLSADADDWLTSSPSAILPTQTNAPVDFPLLPGVLRTGLMLICLPICFRRSPRFTSLLLAMAVTSFIMSFGPKLSIGTWNPWLTLTHILPPLEVVRSPYRFAYFTQISIVLLTSFGVGEIGRSRPFHRGKPAKEVVHWLWPPLRNALYIALLYVAAFEVIPNRSYLYHPPLVQHTEAWVRFIASETPAGKAVLCLPVADGFTEQASQQEAVWMMYGTQHKIPILNGYSGFTPRAWRALQESLRTYPFSHETLDQIRRSGTHFVVVRKDRSIFNNALWADRFAIAFEDERYVIYSFR